MKYYLIDQKKIECDFAPFDADIINRMLKSIDNTVIGDGKRVSFDILEGEPYPVLTVNDIGHTCGLICFYVVGIVYGTIILKYKEFIS